MGAKNKHNLSISGQSLPINNVTVENLKTTKQGDKKSSVTSTFTVTPEVNIVKQEEKDKQLPVYLKPAAKMSAKDSKIEQDKKFLVF